MQTGCCRTRPLKLTWPSVTALRRDHAAERQSLGRAADAMSRSGSPIREALNIVGIMAPESISYTRPDRTHAMTVDSWSPIPRASVGNPARRWRSATWCSGRMRSTGEARAVGCDAPTGTAARSQAGRRPHGGGPRCAACGGCLQGPFARLHGTPKQPSAAAPVANLPSGSRARAEPSAVESERRTLRCRHATVWA